MTRIDAEPGLAARSAKQLIDKEPRASRFAELDGLRGIAIVMVLVWHYVAGQVIVEPGSGPAIVLRLIGFTWMGVDLFFVLSGFLVGRLLLSCGQSRKGVVAILVRRFFRIIPLYVVAIALFGVAIIHVEPDSGAGLEWLFDDPMPMWSYATLTQNIVMADAGTHGAHALGVTWSLALEIQFYFALALLAVMIPGHQLARVLVATVVLAVILRTVMTVAFPGGGFAAFLNLPTRFDAVALGMLVAMTLTSERWQRTGFQKFAADRELVLWSAVGVCVLIAVGLNAKGHGIGSLGMNAVGHICFALACALLIILATSGDDGWFRRVLRTPLLVKCGTISYGIYLMHQPIAGCVHHLALEAPPRIADLAGLIATLCATGLTFMLAYFSWHAFEQPMIKLGRRLSGDASRTPAAAYQ